MERLAAIILLSVALIAPSIQIDPNRPLPIFAEKWTCDDIIELYAEAGSLYQAAGERLEEVQSPAAKLFWIQMREFTKSLHSPLLQAKDLKCKEA